jgi:hypothetical protein
MEVSAAFLLRAQSICKNCCCVVLIGGRTMRLVQSVLWTLLFTMGLVGCFESNNNFPPPLSGDIKISSGEKYVGVFEYVNGSYVYNSATGGFVSDKRKFIKQCLSDFQGSSFSAWSDGVQKILSRQQSKFELVSPRKASQLLLYFGKRPQNDSSDSSLLEDFSNFGVIHRKYGVLRLKAQPSSVQRIRNTVTGAVAVMIGNGTPADESDGGENVKDYPADGAIILSLIGYYLDASNMQDQSFYNNWFGGNNDTKGPRRTEIIRNIGKELALSLENRNEYTKVIELLRAVGMSQNISEKRFGPFHKITSVSGSREDWEVRLDDAMSGDQQKALRELIDIVFGVVFDEIHGNGGSNLSSYLSIDAFSLESMDSDAAYFLDGSKSFNHGVGLYKQGKLELSRVYLVNAYARGIKEAMYYLGLTYNPNMVYQNRQCDNALGVAMVKLAAEQGVGEAQFRLSTIYERGMGEMLPVDLDLAVEWALAAKTNGVEVPVSRIDSLYTKMAQDYIQKHDEKSWYQSAAFRKLAKLVSVSVVNAFAPGAGSVAEAAVGFVLDSTSETQASRSDGFRNEWCQKHTHLCSLDHERGR